MLGAIIGDIVGSRFEFANYKGKDFELFGPGCDYTDDTILTVATADAILNGRSYRDAYVDWGRRYPHPKGAYGATFLPSSPVSVSGAPCMTLYIPSTTSSMYVSFSVSLLESE